MNEHDMEIRVCINNEKVSRVLVHYIDYVEPVDDKEKIEYLKKAIKWLERYVK